MRTTLALDEDVASAARKLAAARKQSLGKVVSDLARKGLSETAQLKIRNGMPYFEAVPGARPIASKLVKDLLEDEW